jgi:uncharacterized protein YcaQ
VAPSTIVERVAAELLSMASWLGLDRVVVNDRGGLAAELAGAVGSVGSPQ